MSKKVNQKSTPIPPKKVVAPQIIKETKNAFFQMSFFKNFIQLLVILAVILICMKGNEGYSWVWSDLINENLKFISKNKQLNTAQKYQAKFGVDAAALDYIKLKTPDTAIILFPYYNTIISDSSGYQFIKGLGGIKIRVWSTYFLYPRKLVYMDEFEKNRYKNKITHVVCMGNWGYNYLDYPVESRKMFDVLPLHSNKSQLNLMGN
ncbi:MAG: hypothetical protein SFY32_03815 [Bacteroidota bacterium]|nr:hypothetical protein [Bacteroidota bacterium]